MHRADDPWATPHRGLLLASLSGAVLALASLAWAWLSSASAGDTSGAAAATTTASHGLDIALIAAIASTAGFGLWWLMQRTRAGPRRPSLAVRPQQLLGLLDVWFWQTDREHRLVRWRPPWGASDAGFAATSPLGRLPWDLLHSVDGSEHVDLKQKLEGEAALADLLVLSTAADGTPTRWLLRCQPRLDAEGRFEGHDGTLRRLDAPAAPLAGPPDIAAQLDALPQPALWAEADPEVPQVLKLRHVNAAAAGQLGAAASALAGQPLSQNLLANSRADAAEQESFSYTVSHDLRAPIRVVEGFTKILKEDYGRLLDRIGNDHLDRVLGAAARMNSMIDALLALSQLSARPLTRQPVNLSQLASYVVEDLRRQHPERTVDTAIAPDLQAHGDPVLLRVVLENLLGNAWKYTGKCRATAHIEFGVEQRTPSGSGTRALSVYFVRDNGAGFDMQFADRLFGVFQRLHSANDFPGTGIGLASVRRIVRRHGGDIWAESEVERGASFYFTLP